MCWRYYKKIYIPKSRNCRMPYPYFPEPSRAVSNTCSKTNLFTLAPRINIGGGPPFQNTCLDSNRPPPAPLDHLTLLLLPFLCCRTNPNTTSSETLAWIFQPIVSFFQIFHVYSLCRHGHGQKQILPIVVSCQKMYPKQLKSVWSITSRWFPQDVNLSQKTK